MPDQPHQLLWRQFALCFYSEVEVSTCKPGNDFIAILYIYPRLIQLSALYRRDAHESSI